MTTTKQAIPQKKDEMYWIATIGTILLYITSYVLIIVIGIKNATPVTGNGEIDVFQIIWDSLANAGTLIPLCVSIISAVLLRWKNKRLSTLSIVVISGLGFFLYCFYCISVKYYIHQAIVAFVGIITFVVSVIVVLLQPSKAVIRQGSIIRNAYGNKIKNSKISGIQIFECTMTEENDTVNYAIQSVDHLSNDDSDINGMLSVTYRLKKADVNGFEFVTKTNYQALVESANDDTKDELIKLIEDKCADIKQRLQNINTVSDVTKDDCCLARILVMYNAYLKILKPTAGGTGAAPDAYIGEQDFRDGDLGVEIEIEKRLFTLIRTGLLGGVLAGPNCIYHFQYRKDGYKEGRQYCVFHINEGSAGNQSHIFLCIVVLKEGTMKAIPPYVLQAIRKMIPVVEKSLQNSLQEVNP